MGHYSKHNNLTKTCARKASGIAALLLFPRALQLHLRGDKFVFDIIEVILFFVNNALKLLIFRYRLEIIVRNIEIEKKMSHVHRKFGKFRVRIEFIDLTVNVLGYPEQVFFALIAAERICLASDVPEIFLPA